MLRFFFAILFLLPLSAWAELRLAVWRPPGYKYAFVVPVRESETPEKAVARYLAALNMNSDIKKNLLTKPIKLNLGSVTELKDAPNVPRALIVSNREDNFARDEYYQNLPGKELRKRRVEPYVRPLVMDVGLSRAETEELRKLVAKEFDLRIGLGGDDIHPITYDEKIKGARGDLSLTRDLSEIEELKRFTSEKRGFYAGFCRGSQILGVAMGCSMVQDIPSELNVESHAEGTHKILLDRKESEHFRKIFPGKDEIIVNTYHHQSVDTKGNSRLRVVARDIHGIVEGTELTNGFGMGFQFHPEEMTATVKRPVFDYLAERAHAAYRERTGKKCPAGFAALIKQNKRD